MMPSMLQRATLSFFAFFVVLAFVTLAFVTLASLTLASAQAVTGAWTVQTGAFRDPAEAAKHVRSLEGLGLNAYTEAVTVGRDPYLRVRAGCFLNKEGADAVTLLLRQRPQEEAAVTAPLSPDAPARLCAAYELGFRPPEDWEVVSRTRDGILFRVARGTHRGFVAFDGASGASSGRWRVLQENERARWEAGFVTAPQDLRSQPFEVSESGGFLLARTLRGETLVVGAGTLLWQGDRVAVAQLENMVVAIRLEARPY